MLESIRPSCSDTFLFKEGERVYIKVDGRVSFSSSHNIILSTDIFLFNTLYNGNVCYEVQVEYS